MSDPFQDSRNDANLALKQYYDLADDFYNIHIRNACKRAAQNITDTRLIQVEKDIRNLTKQINASPSFGLFLIDLALSFIPIIGGHYLEDAMKFERRLQRQATQKFHDTISTQRHWELFKAKVITQHKGVIQTKKLEKKSAALRKQMLDPKISDEIWMKYHDEYEKVIKMRSSMTVKEIGTAEELGNAMMSVRSGGISDETFEFLTPVINDWFQEVGQRLLDIKNLQDIQELARFANPSNPITIPSYYKLAIQRYRDSPAGLVQFIVDDICNKQLAINKSSRATGVTCNKIMCTKEFFEQEKNVYTKFSIGLPKDSDLSVFLLDLEEMLEAAMWLMFLPHPKDWISTKNKDGSYISQRGGMYAPHVHFYIERNLPEDIEKHLLDTFRPKIGSSDTRSFRDYYTDEKKENLGPYQSLGLQSKSLYRYKTPNEPPELPEDTHSTSYTANETALANLQIHFLNLAKLVEIGEPYFTKIMKGHVLK
jgi:hypothetical protein